jgi:hypothetical protein
VVFDKIFVGPLLFFILAYSLRIMCRTSLLVITLSIYLEEFDVLHLLARTPAAEVLHESVSDVFPSSKSLTVMAGPKCIRIIPDH